MLFSSLNTRFLGLSWHMPFYCESLKHLVSIGPPSMYNYVTFVCVVTQRAHTACQDPRCIKPTDVFNRLDLQMENRCKTFNEV